MLSACTEGAGPFEKERGGKEGGLSEAECQDGPMPEEEGTGDGEKTRQPGRGREEEP